MHCSGEGKTAVERMGSIVRWMRWMRLRGPRWNPMLEKT